MMRGSDMINGFGEFEATLFFTSKANGNSTINIIVKLFSYA
jgi:hypothetical protein